MSRVHGVLLLLALSPALAGCPAAPARGRPMTGHGLTIERIEPDHRVVLADGMVIAGDARLAEALQTGGGIREVVVIERMPPVFVVTFADGETRRYRSRKAS